MDEQQQTGVEVVDSVLAMVGDQDYAIGTEHYKSFRFPRAKVVHYIGGHAPFQEEPQWFAEKILDFTTTL